MQLHSPGSLLASSIPLDLCHLFVNHVPSNHQIQAHAGWMVMSDRKGPWGTLKRHVSSKGRFSRVYLICTLIQLDSWWVDRKQAGGNSCKMDCIVAFLDLLKKSNNKSLRLCMCGHYIDCILPKSAVSTFIDLTLHGGEILWHWDYHVGFSRNRVLPQTKPADLPWLTVIIPSKVAIYWGLYAPVTQTHPCISCFWLSQFVSTDCLCCMHVP